ncbi:MAG TPA: type II toxin-antitoxin system RelE/ParE family toxin [Clostridiaceae bacterium]|nr:type II toxin-antitoxin system RelE/ParE family toxin [Clostridiaceae bacterium]
MWTIKFSPEAEEAISKLDHSLVVQVLAEIKKVSSNPLPHPNGYGKPLGNKAGNNLTGFFKIKYGRIDIHVVYSLVLNKQIMNILIVSNGNDDECYKLAGTLYKKYGSSVFDDIF